MFRTYIIDVLSVFNASFEEIEKRYEFDESIVDTIPLQSNEEEKKVSSNFDAIIQQYHITFYPNTIKYTNFFQDFEQYQPLVQEILESKIWCDIIKTNKIKRKTIPASVIKNKTKYQETYDHHLEKSIIGFKMKKARHWYPAVVIMYEKPVLVLVTPKGDWDNGEWLKVIDREIEVIFL